MTSIHIKHIIPDFLWIMLKPYISLRKLIDDNRAAPIIADVNKLKLVDTDMNTDSKANADVRHYVQFISFHFIGMNITETHVEFHLICFFISTCFQI